MSNPISRSAGSQLNTGSIDPLAVAIVDSSGNQISSFGGAGGTAQTDRSGFTEGTTTFTPIGGVMNDVVATPVAENTAAVARITPQQAIHVNLRDASGSEVSPGAGTQYTETDTDSSITGTAIMWEDALDTLRAVSAAKPLPIGDAGGSLTVDNGGTFAVQAVGTGTAGTAATGVLTVQGIASMTKLLVTPDSVALPANQSVNVAQINGVTPLMGAGNTGTGSPRVTIATDQLVIPVSDNAGSLTVDGSVTVTQATGTNLHMVVDSGTVTTVSTVTAVTGGGVAHDGADSGNPLKVGGRATNVEIAAVSATNDRVDFVADLVGKQIVLPYANPENFVSGVISSAMTGTTSTSLVAAPASGLRNYITQITVSNSHATVGTDILIQDGNGGTTLYVIPAAPAFGGAVLTFPTPLRQPTTATAIYCANVTTGSNTKVSASGYKGV